MGQKLYSYSEKFRGNGHDMAAPFADVGVTYRNLSG
jgi:hypothetical protein